MLMVAIWVNLMALLKNRKKLKKKILGITCHDSIDLQKEQLTIK